MKRKGFTLIEALLGLFLLGLISVTTLPILTSSLLNINKSRIKIEMNYIGEMAIERIKSFGAENTSKIYIFDTKVSDIVDSFRNNDTIELILHKVEGKEKYLLKIVKEQRSNMLWMITVYVYHDEEGSNLNCVEYKTYLLRR